MQKLKKRSFVSLTICPLVMAFLLSSCAGSNDLQVSLQETEGEYISEETTEGTTKEMTEEITEGQDSIYVQITGAVRLPGVYEMPSGSRVFEAVEKAGGMLEEAETSAVNQALSMTDGQMIHIYTKEEWKAFQEAGESLVTGTTSGSGGAWVQAGLEEDERVNINTADKEQLCTIPGIGETRAESILTYRQEHGDFSSIEDIKKVTGIKDGLFQKIKDKIKV